MASVYEGKVRPMEQAVSDQLAVGRAVQRLREGKGLEEAELAARVGLDAPYIPAVETGEIDVRWHMLMTLLRALDVGVGDLAAELDGDNQHT
jgi:transcriptional regulator with XRE-family HTH domain